MDNMQVRFAGSFASGGNSLFTSFKQIAAKFYLTKIKGYDPVKIAIATLLFEGSKEEVNYQEKMVYSIAAKYNGIQGGESNGRRGYQLTFLIAYIRDFVMAYNFIAESMETSVPWSKVNELCRNTKKSIIENGKRLGVQFEPFVTFRLTLLYETVILS
jgi:alkyldihydroxyacetonephosphate synthase